MVASVKARENVLFVNDLLLSCLSMVVATSFGPLSSIGSAGKMPVRQEGAGGGDAGYLRHTPHQYC